LGALHDLYDRFGEQVAFYVVYIKEAHPEDGWVLTYNRDQGVRVVDPSSDAEREEVAGACIVRQAIRMPVLIDGVDNDVASVYGGWPDQLYLIGRDGRVTFQGDRGPFGFLPERLEAAIEAELSGVRL